jgi:hypothetical protein
MSSLGLGSGATPSSAPTEETVINNYYNNDGGSQQADNDADNTRHVADNNVADNNDNGLQQADYDNDDGNFDDQSDFSSDDSFNV